MTDDLDRRRMLWRARKARQRERERLMIEGDIGDRGRDLVPVTPPVTHPVSPCGGLPSVTPSVTHIMSRLACGPSARQGATLPNASCETWRLRSVALTGIALALFGAGLAINGWFARSLGSTPEAGWLFLAVGVASDSAAFVLPRQAEALWHQRRMFASAVAWGLWSVTFAFALIASAGFASVNISDVTSARAARSSPAIELAQRRLDAATAAVAAECQRVGPLCRARQAEERQAFEALAGAQAAVAAAADPQTTKSAQLVAWVSPWRPTDTDVGMLRLALLTLLPQLGGLVLLVARQ
jgi:hypothetical protein